MSDFLQGQGCVFGEAALLLPGRSGSAAEDKEHPARTADYRVPYRRALRAASGERVRAFKQPQATYWNACLGALAVVYVWLLQSELVPSGPRPPASQRR